MLNKSNSIWLNNLWIMILYLFKENSSLFYSDLQTCFGLSHKDAVFFKKIIFILTTLKYKFQCELMLPSWNCLTNLDIVSINHMSFLLISRNLDFENQIKLSLNFNRHWCKITYLQYDILENFFPLRQSAVLHRIEFFYLDGLRGSDLKEHISPHATNIFIEI